MRVTKRPGRGTRNAERGTEDKQPWQIYEARFSKYGPNNITVEYGDGNRMPLQFFGQSPQSGPDFDNRVTGFNLGCPHNFTNYAPVG